MQLEKNTVYNPIMQLLAGRISFVLKDGTGRVYADVTEQVMQADPIQDCIDAITVEGGRVGTGSNSSWRAGMFHAAEVLRQLKSKE